MEENAEAQQASYLQDASVEWNGQTFQFSAADGRALESRGNYWHGPADPSTWLAVAVFLEAQQRVGEAGNDVALELAAKALGITAEQLRSSIEWQEQYMRFHDGDYDYKIL